MAVSYSGLVEADFDALASVGDTWKTLADTLESEAGTIEDLKRSDEASLGADHWEGEAAEAGHARLREIVIGVDDRAASARRVWASIVDAAEAFKSCRSDLESLIAEAPSRGVAVSDSGAVTPRDGVPTDTDQAALMRSDIDQVLDRATEADEALKVAVGIWAETFSEAERLTVIGDAADEAEALQELVDSGASPEQVGDWWAGLSEAERLGILEGSPELVADLDGIPTDTRDSANRDLLDAELDRFDPTLDAEIADLESQLAELEAAADDGRMDSSAEIYDLAQQLQDLRTEQERRDSLLGLQDAITGHASTGQDYYLLGYDSAGDGKAIVSVGNPDTADNTAVYVPGTTADLDGFGGEIARAETMAVDAREMASGEETAVIAWLDYDAPDQVMISAEDENEVDSGAGFMSHAEEAGPVLAQFTQGLEATHTEGGAHTTVVGHSYGTTVVGHSASEYGLETDKIIAVASPGLDTAHASDLGIGAENVFVSTAEGDAIRMTTDDYGWSEYVFDSITGNEDPPDAEGDGAYAWHGQTNPLHDDYGAVQFASDATDKHGNESTSGTDIHSGYWAEENIARDNMAYIITDQTEEVTPAAGYES